MIRTPLTNCLKSSRPTRLLSAGVLGSLAMFGLIAWRVQSSQRELVDALTGALQGQELAGTIVYLDEVLTMSARMGAVTGDSRWEARYLDHEPKLDEAIRRAMELAQDAYDVETVRRTEHANARLVALEHEGFRLIREGRREAAMAAVFGDEYLAWKQDYAAGLDARIAAMNARVATELAVARRRAYVVALLSVVGLLLLLAVWVLALRLLSRYAQDRESARRSLQEERDLLEQRIRERTADLESAKIAAESGAQAKSAFLANMSHEIRTPMTAILGFADVLGHATQNEDASPEDREAIDAIRRNGAHLLHLLNDILDLTKIDAGGLTVERVPCPLGSIIADVQSTLHPRAVEKALTLSAGCVGRIPMTIHSDPVRLRQILINVLGNAIKFTSAGGVHLTVRLADRDSPSPRLQFDFTDTGVGMTREQAERAFQPFSQGDDSTTRRFGGTGLGLAISKRLAELLGGELVIADTGPGMGTRFRLTIDPGPIREGELTAHLPTVVQRAAAPETFDERESLTGLRVLFAEDGLDNQRLIGLILRRAGAVVETVNNGREAVAAALAAQGEARHHDVILMDMQMPEMDGYEATRRLRSEGYDRPIIALTAHAMVGDREKCLQAGCDDFATKPIDRAQLVALIRVLTAASGEPVTTGGMMGELRGT